MTPENKDKAKELIVKFLTEKHPTYPEIPLEAVVEAVPKLYKLLVENQIFDTLNVPLDHFQHIVVDQFRSAMIAQQMENFF